ncbi:substrate-binding periplasmic protein [Salidesulfovibrio onnuriiensis]|uniref:substrate-binding periplasmic protein n=1 Tax=Salidesulfovibrio onnuriiensis TaxID=2583823 RepID=UPI0016501007|nr:transporter substrate-binding domain-containing protein [Salidesulfovibrio onnuriiensis]
MVRSLIFILVTLCCALPVHAGDPVRIFTEEFPPFNYMEGGKVGGISTAVVEAAFQLAGVEYTISLCKWRRAMAEIKSSPNTFVYTMARTPSREDEYAWVGKLFDRELILYRHRDRDDLAQLPFEELRHKTRPCVIRDDAAHEWLLSLNFPEENIYQLSGFAVHQCPKMVQEKHADFAAINPYSLKYMIRAGQLEDVFVAYSCILKEDGYYLATGLQSDPVLVEKLRRAFARLAAEGLNERLAEDYLCR